MDSLSQQIFTDASLSEPKGRSCTCCHPFAHAFTGYAGSSVSTVAQGSRLGVLGTRCAPSLLYAALTSPLHFE